MRSEREIAAELLHTHTRLQNAVMLSFVNKYLFVNKQPFLIVISHCFEANVTYIKIRRDVIAHWSVSADSLHVFISCVTVGFKGVQIMREEIISMLFGHHNNYLNLKNDFLHRRKSNTHRSFFLSIFLIKISQ